MRFPDDSNRLSIIGSTGSGKTQAALWHLSHRNFHIMPWIVYNFKMEQSIDSIPYAKQLALNEIPVRPGIYIVHPLPQQLPEVQNQMFHIWKTGGMGLYVDEGYMMGNHNEEFRAILTQGRTKRIPVIVLSQRPVWMDRFVFSESEFFQVFRLNHKKDIKNVEEFIPADLSQSLPDYHSFYYDVGEREVKVLKPVPDLETIHRTFEYRLRPIRQVI